jgi:hypothetical protein
VNSGFYCDVLRRLRGNVRRRRPELWRVQTWLLNHHNAPSHPSVFTQHFLAKHKMSVILRRPYSPDLAPCDFFLFPKMKLKLKGHRFGTNEDPGRIADSALHSGRKGLPGSVPKMEETVGPVSTCGRELLRG